MATTHLKDIGEFGLIDRLSKEIKHYHNETIKGIGDDTAVLDTCDQNFYNLITKDLLMEGVHFNIMYAPMRHLGYKAIAVNLSDIYAMNGTPTHVVVGIAVSAKYTLEAIEEIYEGIRLACDKYKVDLIGGDTTSSVAGLALSVTAFGRVEKDRIAYRSGAKAGDLICVSGNLGAAYAGLLVLEREKEVFKVNPEMQPDISKYSYVVERQLKPEPCRDIHDLLQNLDVIPTAMIDISDGLASELMHISKASGTGVVVYEERIPVDLQTASVAHEFKIDPTTFALNGGEDYELLFCIKQSDYEKVKDNPLISVIGHISENPAQKDMVATSGNLIPLKAQGWDSFK